MSRACSWMRCCRWGRPASLRSSTRTTPRVPSHCPCAACRCVGHAGQGYAFGWDRARCGADGRSQRTGEPHLRFHTMPLPKYTHLEHVRFGRLTAPWWGLSQLAIAWKRVLQYQAEDATVYGEVVSVNRGGLLVDVEGLRGFVPLSHVSSVRVAPPDATRNIHTRREIVPVFATRIHSRGPNARSAPCEFPSRRQGHPWLTARVERVERSPSRTRSRWWARRFP